MLFHCYQAKQSYGAQLSGNMTPFFVTHSKTFPRNFVGCLILFSLCKKLPGDCFHLYRRGGWLITLLIFTLLMPTRVGMRKLWLMPFSKASTRKLMSLPLEIILSLLKHWRIWPCIDSQTEGGTKEADLRDLLAPGVSLTTPHPKTHLPLCSHLIRQMYPCSWAGAVSPRRRKRGGEDLISAFTVGTQGTSHSSVCKKTRLSRREEIEFCWFI